MKQSIHLIICLLALFSIQCETRAQSEIKIGEVYSIYSEAMQMDREYRVLLPESYATSEEQYPVIYVLDGGYYYLSAYSAVQSLSGLGAMPESIVVAVSNPDRRSDMSPPEMDIPGLSNANADDFLKFMADELVPFISATYRTRPLNVLIGHSHGAIFNLYTLVQRADVFNWHLALDAPVHLDNNYLQKTTESFILNNASYSGRLVVGWSRYAWDKDGWNDLVESKKAWEIDLSGENHSSMYHIGFYKGLKQLFSDYRYEHKEILAFKTLEERYKTINEEYGYDIPIPVWALRYGAIEHLAAAEPEEAELFLDRLKAEYGSSQLLDDNGDEWLAALKANPPATTRAMYLSKADATPGEAEIFQGVWSDGRYTIKISTEEEKLAATIDQKMPDGSVLTMNISKIIRLADGSLELSHENGMAPRSGLIVFKLSVPRSGNIEVERRFMVYWPKMDGRNRPTRMVLSKYE